MQVDEKIAELERMRRIKEQMEQEEQGDTEDISPLTVEEALQGIHEGKLDLRNGELMEFETKKYFKQEFPFVIFKDFYQASQEEESGLILVNHDRNISQIMSWNPEKRKAVTLNQWANLLVNGMAANRMHAKIIKKESLKTLEYICFEVPAGGSMVWNIMFRFKDRFQWFSGNYNCMKQDADTYGVCMEAMVWDLDQWMSGQEGAQSDHAGEQKS
ncbi:MAG: hypothetical protein K2N95_03830 [Lachnospiraceae bacterium]|nr:hypothetical protein [Lachnospiraceae bacterium]